MLIIRSFVYCHARSLSLIVLLSLLSGCVMGSDGGVATAPPLVTVAAGWQTLAPGLESRIYTPPNNSFGSLYVLRIDPSYYTFRAHYRPGAPLLLNEWQATLPGAIAIINANFFDQQNNALGLVVADGIAYGQAYSDRGGMLQVQNGGVRVRSTILEPYFGEPLEQAVQAFPMLVTNGVNSFNNPDNNRSSRRTVAAQDAQGRILLMVTPLLGLSLLDLAAYLPTTDMQIVNAVNLDGGGSTMMYVSAGTPYTLASFDAVPTVLAIYAR